MSRIGNKRIIIPDKVKVSLSGNKIIVEGPLGKLPALKLHPKVTARIDDGKIVISRVSDDKIGKSMHGLTRTLIANMIKGVTEGFSKTLEIVGVGYNAKVQGKKLVLNVGFNAPVDLDIPEALKIESINPTKFMVKGPDKQQVGEFAAEIRQVRPPEPYKGKGIRYEGEVVRRKAGKAVVGTGT